MTVVVVVVVRGEDKVSLPHIPGRDGRQSVTAAPMSLHGKCPASPPLATHSHTRTHTQEEGGNGGKQAPRA